MKTNEPAPVKGERVMAVDALRGFDMFWIVGGGEMVKRAIRLVADPMPGALEAQFEHVEWVGFAAWDLIMPLFLFIVGVSMPLAYTRRLEQGQSKRDLYLHLLRRVAILWVLGMIAQGNLLSFDLGRLHLYSNTLQAIASGYAIATVIILNVGVLWQAVSAVALLVLYWALLQFVPIPGHAAGTLEQHANLAMLVDETILGRFRDGTTYTWILSSITFASTVLLGAMAGHILRSGKAARTKAGWLLGMGVAGLALGLLWSFQFPIIKHIWTSSFVLYAAGWSFLLLGMFYIVMDVLKFRRWAFGFVVIGANAIVAYMVGEFISARFVEHLVFREYAAKMPAAAAFSVAVLVFGSLWLALYLMYRKKIFVRI